MADREGDGPDYGVPVGHRVSGDSGQCPAVSEAIDDPEVVAVARAFVAPDPDATSVGSPGWFLAQCSSLRAVLDAEGRFVALGSAWPEVLGWPCERLLGRLLDGLVHPGDRPAVEQALMQLRAGGNTDPFTTRLRHQQGGYRALRWQPVAVPELGVLAALVQDVSAEFARLHHLEELVEQSADGRLEIDSDGWILAVDARIADRLGAAVGDLVGRPVAQLLGGGDPREQQRWQQRLHAEVGARLRQQARLRHADGSAVPVQVAVGARLGPDGSVAGFTAVVTDVSELEARRREVDEANARLEQAHALARLGTWYADLGSGQLTASTSLHELTGLEPDDPRLTMARFPELVHCEDRARFLAHSQQALVSQQPLELRYRLVIADGQIRVMRAISHRVLDADGRKIGLQGTLQDVTELDHALTTVREREELLQRVLTATNDGWWDVDLVTGECFYSQRWWRIHGREPDELPSDPDLYRRHVVADDQAEIEALLAEVVARRQPTFTATGRAIGADGRELFLRIRALVDYDDHGRPVRVSGATTDITAERQAELLEEGFVSTVSHELRTPLTSIGGALELLGAGVAGEFPAAAGQLLEVAARNTDRLRRLIDDLLDVERLMSGQARFETSAQPLVTLVHQAIADNALYARAHRVRFEVEGELHDVEVEVDRDRLQQVLANLLSNAAKFAPTDSVVRLRTRHGDLGVRVEVVDRGEGVPEAFAARLFGRFSQADPSDPRNRGGTGLGLAITREIVERLGGRVGYERVEDESSCFWFELPIVAADAQPAVPGQSPVTGPRSASTRRR